MTEPVQEESAGSHLPERLWLEQHGLALILRLVSRGFAISLVAAALYFTYPNW